jgi:hypothetical protein
LCRLDMGRPVTAWLFVVDYMDGMDNMDICWRNVTSRNPLKLLLIVYNVHSVHYHVYSFSLSILAPSLDSFCSMDSYPRSI